LFTDRWGETAKEETTMPNEFVHVREIRTPEGLTSGVYANGVGVSF
jgi:DNA-binding transcriptional regulator YiaG